MPFAPHDCQGQDILTSWNQREKRRGIFLVRGLFLLVTACNSPSDQGITTVLLLLTTMLQLRQRADIQGHSTGSLKGTCRTEAHTNLQILTNMTTFRKQHDVLQYIRTFFSCTGLSV